MRFKALFLALLFSTALFPATGKTADRYSQLLTSGAWCSVRAAPDGRRLRIIFHRDGHYVLTGNHHGNKGHWRLKGGALYMGEGDVEPQAVAFEAKKSARGRLMLFVDGEEFVRCK